MVIFQFKHFLADFPFQTQYMLRKYNPDWEWVFPLILHCFVHGMMTLCIMLYFKPQLWWLAILDFILHMIMDKIKASPLLLGRYSNTQRSGYWYALGFDQMVHHLTHIYIVWVMVTQ